MTSTTQFRNYCVEEMAFLAGNGAIMAADCIRNRLDMFERAGLGPDVQPTAAQLERVRRLKTLGLSRGGVSDEIATASVLSENEILSQALVEHHPLWVADWYLTKSKSRGPLF